MTQHADYALSDEDRMIVQKTTENVDAASRPRCIAIHKNMLGKAHSRREELLRELRAVDRVIAMRSASLVALNDGDPCPECGEVGLHGCLGRRADHSDGPDGLCPACGGSGLVEDQNWSPEFPEERRIEGVPGHGFIRCGYGCDLIDGPGVSRDEGYAPGDGSTCGRCGRAIWLSEFRPGEAARGHGVWLSTPWAASAACGWGDDGRSLPHIPTTRERQEGKTDAR